MQKYATLFLFDGVLNMIQAHEDSDAPSEHPRNYSQFLILYKIK